MLSLMTLIMKMSLRQENVHRVCGPLLGLSPLELEVLLDQSFEEVRSFYEENHGLNKNLEKRQNYFFAKSFLDGCKSVTGKISREKHLETPQIFVEMGEKGYSTKYNPQINQRIAEKLAQFKRTNGNKVPADKIFSKQFTQNRNWIIEQQLAIVKYLCDLQEIYLQTGNLLDLKPVNQQNIVEHINYSASSVCRLIKNLSTKIPSGRVIFAYELIPGAKETNQKGTYALMRLKEDQTLYENGRWKVSDRELVPILENRFGIQVARRTISKYKRMTK